MNYHVPDQDKNTSAGRKMLLPLVLCVLAAAAGGFLICYHSTKAGQPTAEQETIPETDAESEVLETNLSAAASVQTEISDILVETVAEPSDSAAVPESTSEQETLPPSSAEEIPASSELHTEIPTEQVFTTEEQETLPSEMPEETTEETETVLPTVQEHSSTAPAPTSVPEETVIETVTETVIPAVKYTYGSVLESILKTQSFQDEKFEVSNESDISENEFAVYDLDADGQEELIIRWSNTSAGSVTGVIYGTDSEGNIIVKLRTTPYLRFYSNGMIEADTAHHSALAGDFWGYTLYQYHAETGIYQEIGSVDAWDKSVAEENWYTQEVFPAYADISDSGFVYFISKPGENDSAVLSDPLDVTEYQNWHDTYIGSAEKLNLPFRKLTEANIAEVE